MNGVMRTRVQRMQAAVTASALEQMKSLENSATFGLSKLGLRTEYDPDIGRLVSLTMPSFNVHPVPLIGVSATWHPTRVFCCSYCCPAC